MSNQLVLSQAPALPDRLPLVGQLQGLAISLRPHQWVKNTLVFSGLIFGQLLTQIDRIVASLWAFAAFCMASSAIYLLNDLRDMEEDRKHSLKKLRPLAAGTVSPSLATATMILLLLGAGGIGLLLPSRFLLVLAVYVAVNLGYSFGLKRAVILDVMIIAACFVFRAVAGALAVEVKPSHWLVLCTFMLALLVGFGKRRHELVLLGEQAGLHRACLDGYSLPFLDMMMGITAGAAVVTYSLYTMAPETLERFGTRALVLTTPCVLYGIFRYLFLVHKRSEGGDPARLFVTDLPTLVNGALWVGSVCFIVYGPEAWRPW
jgi:4-hydroxybenzoate polyprenyltransferase